MSRTPTWSVNGPADPKLDRAAIPGRIVRWNQPLLRTRVPISYRDLIDHDASLTAAEAAALVDAAIDASVRAGASTLPPSEYICLHRGGIVSVRPHDGRVVTDGPIAAAALLAALLGLDERGSPTRAVPGALLLALARIRGHIDLPTLSVSELRAVLQRTAGGTPLAPVYERTAHLDNGEASANVSAVATDIREAPDAVIATRQWPRSWLQLGAAFAVGCALTLVVVSTGGWHNAPLPTARMTSAPTSRPVVSREPPQIPSAAAPGRVTVSPASPLPTAAAPPRIGTGGGNTVLGAPSASPLLTGTLLTGDTFSPAYGTAGDLWFHVGRPNGSLMKAALHGEHSGSVTTLLHDGAANYHATPSPDGSRLAFDSDRDGIRAVYVAGIDATRPRRVSGDGYAAVPSWSPAGDRLAFIKAESRRASVWNVWIVDLHTGSLTRVTSHRIGQAWRASWFPDGEHLAYSVEDRLVIADLVRNTTRVIRSPVHGRMVRTPAVSPDGTKVMFQVHGDGIWLVDVDTGAMRRLLADRTAEEFTWAPAGDRVAFHARRGGRWSLWELTL